MGPDTGAESWLDKLCYAQCLGKAEQSTACALQPQHLPSPALWMPPHLCPASINHVPLLFGRLPFKLPSSWCLCHPSQNTFHRLSQPKILLCAHRTGLYHTSPKADFSPKLLLWLTLMSELTAQSPGNFLFSPCSIHSLHGHEAAAAR